MRLVARAADIPALDPRRTRAYTRAHSVHQASQNPGGIAYACPRTKRMKKQTQNETLDVKYIAHLARMHITDEEACTFQGQLDHVLEHVRKLSALDVEGVEPTAHAVPVHNVFREDAVTTSLAHDAVMKNAPSARQGLFIVPRILE